MNARSAARLLPTVRVTESDDILSHPRTNTGTVGAHKAQVLVGLACLSDGGKTRPANRKHKKFLTPARLHALLSYGKSHNLHSAGAGCEEKPGPAIEQSIKTSSSPLDGTHKPQ